MIRSNLIRFLLAFLLAVGAGFVIAEDDQVDVTSENQDEFTDRIQESVVFSARVGGIEADASKFRAFSNSEISGRLNVFHTLSPHERRDLLVEVYRRIKVEGTFVVEKDKQHFGKVVSETGTTQSNQESAELQIEEELVARISDSESETESQETRESPHKPSKRAEVRVNSGRAYSQ